MNVPNGRQTPPAQARIRSLTWLALAVPLLFGCSQPAASVPDPYANGVSYPWDYQAPADKLGILSLTPGENNLYFEPILAAHNSWGPIEIDRSNGEQRAGDGKTITLNGKTYSRGFGVHASSELRFSLKGTGGAVCTRFTADVGVDDEVGSRGSVVFQVFLDGVKAYDSGTMTGSSATKQIDLTVSGKTELRMVVTDAGNGISYDHADWAIPKVYCQAPNASGSLDKSFGTGGIANVGGVDAVLEPSGAVLIADSVGGNFVLKRLLASGSVTQVVTDLGGDDTARALLRQPDGKVVLAGNSGNNFALVRYNADLSLDSGFGLGGKVITHLPTTGAETAYALTRQPDGKLVVAGSLDVLKQDYPDNPTDFHLSTDLAVVRYTASGALDTSFGTAGVVSQGFDGPDVFSDTDDEARAIIAQPDGKLLIAGKSDFSGGGLSWLLTRLNASGSLDTGFASGGLVRGGYYGIFNNVTLEPSGNLIVVGYEGRFLNTGRVQRYNASGGLTGQGDVPFNSATFGNQNVLSDVLVQPDGKLLVGGFNGVFNDGAPPEVTTYGVARLNPDLSLDTTFAASGILTTPLGIAGDESPSGALLRQPDGKIVVVSGTQTARYFP